MVSLFDVLTVLTAGGLTETEVKAVTVKMR